MPRDDLDKLRWDRAAPKAVPPAPGPGGTPAFAGKVASTVAISSQHFALVNPVTVLGAETEGGAGAFTVDTAVSIPVYVVGPGAVSPGDDLICRFVDYRWVADRGGVAGPPPPGIVGCFCYPTPATIPMTSLHPTCNGGMFQSDGFTWQTTPPEYSSLSLGSSCYLSDHSFVDANGDTFRYYLTCNLGQFTLTRVYITSIFGSPFRDSVRYSWPIASPGNFCDPFVMTSGQIYLGGDFSCQVNLGDYQSLGTLVVPVTGCNGLPLSGASVTATYQGGSSVSATTDASGNATFSAPAGNYTLSAVKTVTIGGTQHSMFNAGSGAATVTAGSTTTAATIALAGQMAAGYLCVAGHADPLPTTLTLTDSNGGHSEAFTYDPTPQRWIFCYGKSATSYDCATGASTAGQTIPIRYELDTSLNLTVRYKGCATGTYAPAPTTGDCGSYPWGAGATVSQATTVAGTTSPPSLSTAAAVVAPATGSASGSLLNGAITLTA